MSDKPEAEAKPKKKGRKLSPWGVVAWLVALGFFFPVFWMVLTAFKQEGDAATSPPTLFFTPTLDQFGAVFDQGIGPAMVSVTRIGIGPLPAPSSSIASSNAYVPSGIASIARAGMISRPRTRIAGNSPSRIARYSVTGAIPIMRAASGTL